MRNSFFDGQSSLSRFPGCERVIPILDAALLAADPQAAVQRSVILTGGDLQVGDRKFDLSAYQRIFLIAAGKAAHRMSAAVEDILAERLTAGIVITKDGYDQDAAAVSPRPGKHRFFTAGHPLPDERSVEASNAVTHLLEQTQQDDLVLCLLSGGGSALLTAPAVGISLSSLQELTNLLLLSGATINELNALRKHLETLKGGGLTRVAAPAEVISLVLSDVIGDPLDVIASGPTVPDTSTFADCVSILQRYGLQEKTPPEILSYLQRGLDRQVPETPKPGDPLFGNVTTAIIASNYQAASAAVRKAKILGCNSLLLTSYVQGEASQVGKTIAAIAHQIHQTGQPLPRPACLVAGGETTVTVHGNGLGGRNLELALGAVEMLAGLENTLLVTLATDGGDGPTDAAGAVVSGDTLILAKSQGLVPAEYLKRNDSYHFFEQLEGLIKTGPTQTNVNDLVFLFIF